MAAPRIFLSRSSVPVGLTCSCGQDPPELVSNRTVAFPPLPLSISREPVSGHLNSSLRECLVFSGKQPLYRLFKLPTDPQQNLRPDFDLTVLHHGKVTLA